MPRTRQPVATLSPDSLIQNAKHYKERIEREPKPQAPLGPPPRHLSKDEKKIWKELSAVIPAGVAGSCDATLFELTVKLTTKLRVNTISNQEQGRLVHCLQQLGMTPAGRARLLVVPESKDKVEDDKFAKFLQ